MENIEEGSMNVETILSSLQYQEVLSELHQRMEFSCNPEYGKNKALRMQERMKLGKLQFPTALELLVKEKDAFLSFCITKMNWAKGIDTGSLKLGYSQDFILMYLIEFYLIKMNNDGTPKLCEYLKAIRVPGVQNYSKLLEKFYQESTSVG